jgi:hypothetical protein
VENCGGFKIWQLMGWAVLSLSLQEPLGWGCERTLEKVGRHSQAFLELWWGMGLGLDFGIIYGVGDTVHRWRL